MMLGDNALATGLGWTVHQLNPAAAHRPWLVFLHGLLGSGADWSPALPYFNHWPWVTLNLPGHGCDAQSAKAPLQSLDFATVSQGLAHQLASLNIRRYILVGYSLGGRIALYHACFNAEKPPAHAAPDGLSALYVEGAHPGLNTQSERDQRQRHDGAWARRFRQEPMGDILADWYRQPVFSDMSAAERAQLVRLRSVNEGKAVAAMLDATSLSRQPPLTAKLQNLGLPFGYICGERDAKFCALAQQAPFPLVVVPGAGHNAHRANPSAFADLLHAQLAPFY